MKKISENIVTHGTTIEPLPNKMGVSFEFFPPKTPQLEKSLWCSVERLAPLNPVFVSVTYGAGGSTREKTHKIVTRLQNKMGIPAAAHLTCVAASKAEVNRVARRYWEAGIRHIVALRGDPPDGQGKYVAHPEGYSNASVLVRGLKQIGDFEISVAAHPEGHPEAKSIEADIEKQSDLLLNIIDKFKKDFASLRIKGFSIKTCFLLSIQYFTTANFSLSGRQTNTESYSCNGTS